MKQKGCKTYFISLQQRFIEKLLLIIFLRWQQHHNIKENPKCTNFYVPSRLLNLWEERWKSLRSIFNIKYCGDIFDIFHIQIYLNLQWQCWKYIHYQIFVAREASGWMVTIWGQLGGVDTLCACTQLWTHYSHETQEKQKKLRYMFLQISSYIWMSKPCSLCVYYTP